MKFSIVTPSYNQGRFIRDCIESVRKQEGVEWEHIVMDAGSTDETLAVLKEYPHLTWSAEPDRGMSDGINKGFLKTTGEWVMWLNTDDYLLAGTLAKVAEFAAKRPEADVIYGDSVFVKENKEIIRRKHEHRFDFNVLLFYGCYIQSTATFIRRRVIEAGHLLNIDYRICMDFDYYVRLARAGCRFVYLPEALAAFRWHGANASAVQIQRRHEERIKVQRECLEELDRTWLGREWLLSCLFRVFQVKRVMLRHLSRFGPGPA